MIPLCEDESPVSQDVLSTARMQNCGRQRYLRGSVSERMDRFGPFRVYWVLRPSCVKPYSSIGIRSLENTARQSARTVTGSGVPPHAQAILIGHDTVSL